jgi:competence protein ComEA
MLDANPAKSRSPRLSLQLKGSDHRCLCCLVLGIFGFSLLQLGSLENTSNSVSEPVRFQLDLNSASVEEFVLLPGIGEVRANAIVRYRQEYGPFATVDELQRIKGIGPKTLSGLRELVFVHLSARELSNPAVVTTRLTNGHERKIASVPDGLE